MKQYHVTPVGRLSATVRPPGSRSHTNRALVVAALASGPSTLTGILKSEDTQVMLDAWRALGVMVTGGEVPTTVSIDGCGGLIPAQNGEIWVAASGTTMRFLTGVLTTARGRFVLDGVPRMRQRPIADMLAALSDLGAQISTENDDGCPPVIVEADGLPGGQCQLPGNLSSQYLSGLLLAAPLAKEDVTIEITDALVSRPFVEMTIKTLADFGVSAERDGWERFDVRGNQRWDGRRYTIEPDAIAATYFWGAAAVAGGSVRVEGIDENTTQGDAGFVDVLAQMGCKVERGDGYTKVDGAPLRGVDVDMGSMPDAAMTLATVAAFAKGPTRVRGVANMRIKETDRIAAIVAEMTKLGINAIATDDGFEIQPGEIRPAEIDTYGDHRMAMSFALIGLAVPGVVINDPDCVTKTFPNFFEILEAVCRPNAKVTA